MGGGSVASSSNVTLDTSSTTTGEFIPGGVQGVDLGAVLARVKELIRENEELGDMVLEAGRESKDEWQNALEGELSSRSGFANLTVSFKNQKQ